MGVVGSLSQTGEEAWRMMQEDWMLVEETADSQTDEEAWRMMQKDWMLHEEAAGIDIAEGSPGGGAQSPGA